MNPKHIALETDKESYSYAELLKHIDLLSVELRNIGIGKCSKVMILVENPLSFIFFSFAISKLDAICIPIYGRIGNRKIETVIKEYSINYVIRSKSMLKQGMLYDCVYCNNDLDTLIYKIDDEYDYSLINICLILFTSGTTNVPKAIMLTNENIESNVYSIRAYLKLVQEDRILLIKNLSHSSSIIGELFVGLQSGSTIVLSTQLPTPSSILKTLELKCISIFFAVPTLLYGILNYSKSSEFDLSRLRIINFYGAPMSQKNILKLIDWIPGANIIYSYGLTEASPRVTYIEKKDLLIKSSSSGRPIINVHVKIMCDDNRLAAPYEIGEIIVAGPNVMRGYYRDVRRTNEALKDGYLHTGDMGYMDEQGFLYVNGRKDNMIISAGKNIYPEEIESVLISHEDIQEALVVCTYKEDGTVCLTAYVVLVEEKHLKLNEIYQYCKEYIENYKIPNKVIAVKELKKTPSGKIIRKYIQ